MIENHVKKTHEDTGLTVTVSNRGDTPRLTIRAPEIRPPGKVVVFSARLSEDVLLSLRGGGSAYNTSATIYELIEEAAKEAGHEDKLP